jgi:hypothetical protein
MALQVKAHESIGQLGVNPEPLNLEPLNGYIVGVVVFRKTWFLRFTGTRRRVNRYRSIFFYDKAEQMFRVMNKEILKIPPKKSHHRRQGW